jgi:Ca2+/H+ antiporter
VSMMPGVYLFRMMSGLVLIAGGEETTVSLFQGTLSAGANAAIIILAMCLSLIIPKMIIDSLASRPAQPGAIGAAEHVNAR